MLFKVVPLKFGVAPSCSNILLHYGVKALHGIVVLYSQGGHSLVKEASHGLVKEAPHKFYSGSSIYMYMYNIV